MTNKIIFGTDGWRGLLDKEINHDTVAQVAQAFSDYLHYKFNDKKEVAIGFDARKYSCEFAGIFAETLSGNGITAFLSDKVIPTPVLSYYVKANRLNAGVMITASHNPPEYNGIKFKASYGGPFLTEETLLVEEFIGKSQIKKNNKNIRLVDQIEIYYKQLENYIDFDLIERSGINLLADSMGGAGQHYLEEILKRHQCSISTIFGDPGPDFAGRTPEPIEKNLSELKQYLINNPGFSFAVATDGDADRCGVMLENGDWLSAQYTILLLNDFIVNQKKLSGNLVKTSSVTDKIRLFESDEHKVFDVQVGFKYICEKMISEDIAVGCEESGGYGYKGHIPERDGILSSLLMAEMLAKSGFNKLSDYFAAKKLEFGNIYYDRIDYKYDNPDRVNILPEMFINPPKKLLGLEVKGITEFYSSRGIVNGLKLILEGNSKWLLMRSSETEPLIRFYAEAGGDKEVKELLQAGIDLIINKV